MPPNRFRWKCFWVLRSAGGLALEPGQALSIVQGYVAARSDESRLLTRGSHKAKKMPSPSSGFAGGEAPRGAQERVTGVPLVGTRFSPSVRRSCRRNLVFLGRNTSCLCKNSTSALKAVREESVNRRNWMLWTTIMIRIRIRIRKNDRSSCTLPNMFTFGNVESHDQVCRSA